MSLALPSITALVPFLEVAAWAAVLVALHSQRRRLGLGPVYLLLGVTLSYMTIGGPLGVLVPSLVGPDVSYTSVVHLAVLLAGIALVYALEGTREAQRLILAVAVGGTALVALKLALAYHILPLDLAVSGRAAWAAPNVWGSVLSTLILAIDGVVILVTYQLLVNLRAPLVAALTGSLVAAMAADSLLFGTLVASLDPALFLAHLAGKLGTGVAAAIPVGGWISWRYRSDPESFHRGVVHRSVLDIVDLRQELDHTRARLAESRAETAHVREVFGRYVSPDVVEEILADVSRLQLGGELRTVTILFSDIRGYSTLSERMSPPEVIGLLNEYFGVMGAIIQQEGGTIIEFEGDAILAVFNAPADQPDHADRAYRAAKSMLDALEQLNTHWDAAGTSAYWRDLGLDSFGVRVGVHTGEVVVGNVGSETRSKYAVIGDTVNTAARVEGLNKTLRTSLLLTRATVDAMTEDVDLCACGSHSVKGRSEPVEVLAPEWAR